MHWVSLVLLPGWNTTSSTDHDDNRLGFYLGAGAQSWNDRGPDAVVTGAPRVTSAAASQSSGNSPSKLVVCPRKEPQ